MTLHFDDDNNPFRQPGEQFRELVMETYTRLQVAKNTGGRKEHCPVCKRITLRISKEADDGKHWILECVFCGTGRLRIK